jgi:hypothetical protein
LVAVSGGRKNSTKLNTKKVITADASQAIPFDEDHTSAGGKIGNTVGF